jgi:hypothetical protein
VDRHGAAHGPPSDRHHPRRRNGAYRRRVSGRSTPRSARAPVGTRYPLAVRHRLPEGPEIAQSGALPAGQPGALPGRGAAAQPVCGRRAQQRLLPAAECLPQLLSLRGASSWVRAELEGAPVRAARARVVHPRPGDAEVGPHRAAVTDEAWWQIASVRTAEIPFALVGLAPFGQIEQQQHVGDELLGTAVQRRPACRGRDPQVVHPRLGWIARARSHLADHACLVDPKVPLRAAALERTDGEIRRFANEGVQPVALCQRVPSRTRRSAVHPPPPRCPLLQQPVALSLRAPPRSREPLVDPPPR